MALSKILAWCERCERDTLPDVIDLMCGFDPSCSVCGAWYDEEVANELIAAHVALGGLKICSEETP